MYIPKWYFVSKIVLTLCEKTFFKGTIKTFEILGLRPRICNDFDISKAIYPNSGMSDQNAFLTCSWRVFKSNTLEEFKFKFKKYNWGLETYRKS